MFVTQPPLSLLSEDTSEWERELQQELQEYEVVAEADNQDENWDREIEEMLQADQLTPMSPRFQCGNMATLKREGA